MRAAVLVLGLVFASESRAAGDAGPAAGDQDPVIEGVRYPLGVRTDPDLLDGGHPFKLVDLRYGLSDTELTTHAFAARVKVRSWGYVAVESQGERRALSVAMDRLALAASSEQGLWGVKGEYRARRFLVAAAGTEHRDGSARGWRLRPSVSVRLTPDLEVLGEVLGDTARPDDRFVRTIAGGLLWQYRTNLEMRGEYRRDFVATDAGAENEIRSANTRVVAQGRRLELTLRGAARDVAGRFPRSELDGAATARIQVLPRLVAELEAGGGMERGATTESHAYRGAVTWFGRRFTFPRVGVLGERSLALARAAILSGYDERRVFDDDGLRAQRERLGLSSDRDRLSDDIAAAYRAQVAERSVPLLGLEIEDSSEALGGSATRAIRAFIGVPWPPAPPWRPSEAATPFLRLSYAHERHRSALDFDAHTNGLTLTVSLDREMDLVVGWKRIQPTALDLIRGIGERSTFEASYVYAFGR